MRLFSAFCACAAKLIQNAPIIAPQIVYVSIGLFTRTSILKVDLQTTAWEVQQPMGMVLPWVTLGIVIPIVEKHGSKSAEVGLLFQVLTTLVAF